MLVRLLGQIEAVAETPLVLGGPTQRRLLAALSLRRNEVVSVPSLVDVAWPDGDTPDRADHNIRTYVHRLRASLVGHDDRISTLGAGYRLRLDDDELDIATFEVLTGTARRLTRSADHLAALDVVDEAERLWRGRPLEEFEDEPWAIAEAVRLRELRTELTTLRAELLLAAGRVADAVAALEGQVRGEPLRERPRALLMRALYESGRQAEALRAFQEFRRALIDEVGIEPSPDLVELDRAIATGSLPASTGAERSVGGFELHERIGEGAFAVVHRATQTSLGREVAVKIVRSELANEPEFVRRFEAEAKMVARIEHPDVVPLYDYWREPDRAFLVMRYLTGGTLERRLDGGPWPLGDTLDVIDRIAAGLDAAHRVGVVHRDVKPANILFDDENRAYLGDFGVALEADASARPGASLSAGSPVFASPEQLRGEPVGPEADVHALAIVAFTMLAGHSPFAHDDERVRLRRQLDDPIPDISLLRPELPRALGAVVTTAAAKDPRERYPTAGGFALAARAASGLDPLDIARPELRPRANPYKGLRAFDETEADDFFGRTRLVEELVDHLGQPDTRLLVVVGPSGSGKSSVMRAGVLPALRAGRVPGSARWFTTTMTPGSRPFEALETALLRIAVNPPATLLGQLRDGDRGILRGVARILPSDDDVALVLIDQLEELFTGDVSEAERDRFIRGLSTAVSAPDSPVRVVATLRADFYDRPLRHPTFAPLLKAHAVTVTPLAPDELERAIVSPAAAVGLEFEPGLVAEIVAEVNHEPGALPLLQYALTQTFDATDGSIITTAAYRSIGGLTGALARQAEELWQQEDGAGRGAIRRVFGRLVSLGEGTEDTRRRVLLSELGEDAPTTEVVGRYGAARLLTFDRDPVTRQPTVEVAHEALIREWTRLGSWLDEDRDELRAHRHLSLSAVAWSERDQDENELYRGARLDGAEPLLDHPTITLNGTEADFLRASLERRGQEVAAERLRLRRLRRLVVSTAVVAAVALVAGVVAFWQRQRADDQAVRATESESRALASAALAEERADEAEAARAEADLERLRATARSVADESPAIAALLAVEAQRIDPGVESLDVLHRVLTEIPGYRGAIVAGPYGRAVLLDDGVTAVAAGSQSLDVWDLRDRSLVRSIAHVGPPATALIDAIGDERLAAVGAGRDETVVYELETGEAVGAMQHTAIVNDISASSDGARLAVALEGGDVEVWDLAETRLLSVLHAGETDAYFARWSPTGEALAVVTLASDVQMWSAATETLIWSVAGPEAGIVNQVTPFAAAFSPAGDRFAFVSGSLAGGVRTFATADGSEAAPAVATSGLKGFPLDALYWLDDTTIGVASFGNVIEYDLASGTGTTVLDRFVLRAADVVYSSALGQFVAAGLGGLEFWSADGTGPLEVALPLSPEQKVAAAGGGAVLSSLAADGTRLIVSTVSFPTPPPTTSFDLTTDPPTSSVSETGGLAIGYGEYTLAVSGLTLLVLDADLAPLGSPVMVPFDFSEVGMSEDGRYFAIGRLGGLADVYTAGGELLGTVALGEPAEFAGAQLAPWFTSDGRYMVLSTTDGRSGLWSTDPLERIDLPDELEAGWAYAMGSWLFVDGGDGTFVRLDPATLEQVGGAIGLNGLGALGYAKLDQANLRLAATGSEVVKVFDLDAERQLGRELPHAGLANRVEFSADGAMLTVPTEDGITIWNFDTGAWADIACEVAGRNLTRDEWDRLGPRTIDYRPTCTDYPAEELASS